MASSARPVTRSAAALMAVMLGAAGPAAADELLARGVQARTDGDLDRARELLRAAAAAEPSALAPRLELAVTLAWRGELAAAADAYAAALTIDPGSRAARAGAARVAAWRGDTAAGLRGFLALWREQPDDREAALGLAAIYRQLDQPAEARRYYRAALALSPDDDEARAGLRALAADPRREAHAGVGLRAVDGGDPAVYYQAGARARLTGHRWIALTATTAAEPAPAPPRPDGGRARLEVGQAGRRWTRALGYELGREEAGWTHAVDGALARRWSFATIGVTARARREIDGAVSTLGSLGGERALGPVTLGARGFVGRDGAGGGSAAAVAMTAWRRGPIELRVDGSRGWDGAGVTDGLGGRVTVELTAALAVIAAAGVERGARVVDRGELNVVARW